MLRLSRAVNGKREAMKKEIARQMQAKLETLETSVEVALSQPNLSQETICKIIEALVSSYNDTAHKVEPGYEGCLVKGEDGVEGDWTSF